MRLQKNKEERTTNKEILQYFKSPEIRHVGSNSINLKNKNWNIRWLNGWCCCCSVAKSGPPFVTPWTTACQVSLSFSISQSLLKLTSIELLMPSNHLYLCRPLLLLPSIFPSIRVFSNESACHRRWPKYWSFNISPSSEYSGLISLRIDLFDLLAVQGTLNLKASILWCSAFIMVQLSHMYMTTGKTTALTIGTFVDKMMSLLFNMLSMCVITFLARNKHLLISWVQSLCALISEPKEKKKSVTFSPFSPFVCHEVMGLDAKILVF